MMACTIFAYFLTGEIPNVTQVLDWLTISIAVVMVARGNNLKEELDLDT